MSVQVPEETRGAGYPGAGITSDSEPPSVGAGLQNPGSLQE